ncbi:MAG: response regulator transcription factor [Acidimicrobiia bacterium]
MIRVLLVDDHRIVRDGIKWMLVNEPSIEVVGEASSGAEMLRMLTDIEVDVVLLDIRMPGLSGLETMEALNQIPNAPQVLMLSMYHEPGLVQQAVALGAAGYLKKSAGRDELVEAIQVIAGGRPFLQGELAQPLIANLAESPAGPPPRLSARDRSILELMSQGRRNSEIAAALDLRAQQLHTEVQHLFERLGVHSRPEAVAVALRLGAIE